MHITPAPTYAELLAFSQKTLADILEITEEVIDGQFGAGYAIRNPAILPAIARITFDEFCVLRAKQSGSKK